MNNAFGQPKTSRYNRPPRSKKLLEHREKIATRHSNRIQQMREDKEELEKVLLLLNLHYNSVRHNDLK